MDQYRVDLVVQVGEGTPGPFRTKVDAAGPMEAWGAALQLLRRHGLCWGKEYTVLSYTAFQKVDPEH